MKNTENGSNLVWLTTGLPVHLVKLVIKACVPHLNHDTQGIQIRYLSSSATPSYHFSQ